MTTRADVARDIIYEAYFEIVGRGLLPSFELANLKEAIDDVINNVEDEPLTEDQKYELKNKEYLGYRWKE